MFVYRLTYTTSVVNAFDPTEYIIEPEAHEIGLFSNKKKALNALIDTFDNEIEWYIFNNKKMDVEAHSVCDEFDTCRIEMYGQIVWLEGKVEKLEVN